MTGYVIFAIGCFVGAILGMLIMGLCVMSRDADTKTLNMTSDEFKVWRDLGGRPCIPDEIDLGEFKKIVTGNANKPGE